MRLSKRGMELSINMLVVMILGIMVLGGGIVLVNKLVGQTKDLAISVDTSSQEELGRILTRGALVAVARGVRTTTYDKREIFGIGIKNKAMDTKKFVPTVTGTSIVKTNGETIDNTIVPFMEKYADSPITLEPNEMRTNIPVMISIPKGSPKGTYFFSVQAFYDKTGTTGSSWPNEYEEYAPAESIRITIE